MFKPILRRSFLLASLGATPVHAAMQRRPLRFPRDHGAHPEVRTEWWYATGRVSSGERVFGFQVTFFRSRVDGTQAMQSRFAAKQLILAHAAVTDLQAKKLLHAQRLAREGFDVASADTSDTKLALRDWSLVRDAGATGSYSAKVVADDFALHLQLRPTQALLLQGDKGWSRKGPAAAQVSHYYSQPQLAASGKLVVKEQSFEVSGQAWLDHEWSDALLHPDAVGWDWIGMNLQDGSALTAFRVRDKDGRAVWDGGSFRHPAMNGVPHIFSLGEVVFSPQRFWTSATTKARYPVEWIVRTPADFYSVRAVIDNQELNSSVTTGVIYWEGLSDLFDSNKRLVGRGYLEMTGYAKPLRL